MKRNRTWFVVVLLTIAFTLCLFAACGGEEKPDYKLSETAITLTVGESKQLTITPEAKNVSWTSGDSGIASVKDGTVTAVAAGSTTITATIEGADPLTCSVTVKDKGVEPPPVTGKEYHLDFETLSLKTGESKQLTVLDEDGKTAGGVTYSSDDAKIASVSSSGLVKAEGVGETKIRAKVDGTELVCTVTVAQKYTYSLDKTQLDIAAGASETITLITTPEPEGAVRPHTFTSSNEDVATVNGGTGRVTGVGKGTATITCAVDGEELTATVTVTEYTVMIDGQVMGEETTLRVGVEKDITVIADPSTHKVEATFASGNTDILTVEGGHIVPLTAGTTDITVTVGGRQFRTTAIVGAAVQYEINEKNVTLKLGETKKLEVTADPEGTPFTLSFESDDDGIVEVGEDGTLTAKGIGSATVTTTVVGTDVTFETTVNVVLESSIENKDYAFGETAENLTYLDANKTLDWREYTTSEGAKTPARMKNSADLIGDYHMVGCDDEGFWDYKAPILYEDADDSNGNWASGGFTYGRAVHGSYTIDVKLTSHVTKIVLFTGTWKETVNVQFKLGDAVLQESNFSAGENALSRKITLTIDTKDLKEEMTLTIAVNCNRVNGGNASLVAVAVIGDTPHDALASTAQGTVEKDITGAQNITETGTLDWAAVVDENHVAQKADADHVIKTDGIQYSEAHGTAENYMASITWTDGDEQAPASLKSFYHAPAYISIPVALEEGGYDVTLYVTGWHSGYLVAAYAPNGAFMCGYQVTDVDGMNSHSAKVTIHVDAKEAGDYIFKIIRCRDTGNVGWAAVAVAQDTAYSLKTKEFDVTKGGSTVHKIEVLKDGEPCNEAVTFESDSAQVATVDTDGTIQAVGAGSARITVNVGGVKLYAKVNVTVYTLEGGDSITLPKDVTHPITVKADPQREFTASYHSLNGAVADVDESGVISTKTEGEAKIEVTIGDLTLTLTVKVVAYSLNESSIELTLGGSEEKTLQMMNGDVAAEGAVYTSDDESVAEIDRTTGKITVKGFGKTTLHATLEGYEVTLDCEIVVKLKVETTDTKDYAEDNNSVNLDKLDDTNVTLDWRYFGRDRFAEEMKGGSLIGELTEDNRSNDFYDYRVKMSWQSGTTFGQSFFGRNDGITYKGSVSFPVTVTKDVKYISVFTGAYHAANTVTISYNGVVYATVTFENNGDNDGENKCKQIIFAPDMEHFGEGEKTFTITLTLGAESAHGWTDNISLVAIAVVGNTARVQKGVAATAEVQITPFDKLGGSDTIDLTEQGTLDWIYAKNGDNGQLTRKATDSPAILDGEIQTRGGDGYDHIGVKRFTWSDGAEAPADGSVNNFRWINEAYQIPVHLAAGKYEVTLYLSGWKNSYFVTVYDANGNTILSAQQAIEGDGSSSKQAAVKVTLTVTEESTFVFYMSKSGAGNHGYAAVTVSEVIPYSLENSEFDVTKDGTTVHQIKVLKDGAPCEEEVTFDVADDGVATVDTDGTIHAVGAGSTRVTVNVGGKKLYANVTVTVYTIEGGNSITLPKDTTANIVIHADPAHEFTASYQIDEQNAAEVNEEGVITAKEEGEAHITITIGDLTLTLTVKVVAYSLNETSIELTLGEETQKTLTLQDKEGAPAEGAVYTSDDEEIVFIDETTGEIEVRGFGKTTLRAKLQAFNIELTCEVVVKLKVETTDTKDYADGNNSVNLDELDDTNVTLDWRYFGRDKFVDEMKDGSLIGELAEDNRAGDFYDYRAKMNWQNGTVLPQGFLNRIDGITYKGSVSFPVTVTKDVKYIAVFTGAYHAKNTVTIAYNGVVYATYEFENNGDNDNVNKCKQVIFAPDMTHFGENAKTFTITLTVGAESSHSWADNVSLVAIAVVGNTARAQKAAAAATAEVTHEALTPEQDSTIDLTEVGTRDWAYICDSDTGFVRKAGGSAIGAFYMYGESGAGHDGFGTKHQYFTWTDGTAEPSGEGKTNTIKWGKTAQTITVSLKEGATKVILYISAWQPTCRLDVYDAHGNKIVDHEAVLDGNGGDNGAKAEVTFNVTEAGTFTFVFTKEGGESNGNFGLAAIAVEGEPDPVNLEIDAGLDDWKALRTKTLGAHALDPNDHRAGTWYGVLREEGLYLAAELLHNTAPVYGREPWFNNLNFEVRIFDNGGANHYYVYLTGKTDDGYSYQIGRDANGTEGLQAKYLCLDGSASGVTYHSIFELFIPASCFDSLKAEDGSLAIGVAIKTGDYNDGANEKLTGGTVNYDSGDTWYAPYGVWPDDSRYFAYVTADGMYLSEEHAHPEWQFGVKTAVADDKSIAIDGDLSEWSTEHILKIEGSGDSEGKSVTFYGKMTQDGLYLAAEAYHGTFTTNGGAWWQNTNLELRIGRNWGGDGSRMPKQFWVRATGDDTLEKSVDYINAAIRHETVTEHGQATHHTVFELFIPAENLVQYDYMVRNGMIQVGVAWKTVDDTINSIGDWWIPGDTHINSNPACVDGTGIYTPAAYAEKTQA